MYKWIKRAIIAVAIIAGGVALYLQLNTGDSLLRLNGYSYHITVARTTAELEQGLSGTKSLPQDQAKVFAFSSDDKWQIWMKDMNYPIDIVWLNDAKQVIYSVKNAQPSSYNAADPSKSQTFTPDTPARYVIEFAAGTIDRTGIANAEPAGLPAGI